LRLTPRERNQMQPTESTRASRRRKKGSAASVESAATPTAQAATPERPHDSGAEHAHGSDPETPVEADLEPKVAGYMIHPIPKALPPSTEKELAALTDNVCLNGLVQPIVLYEGMILDGRNRAIACERAGVPLRTVPLQEGISPVDYVVAVNLRRRQLTAAQKAVVGAKLAPFYAAEAAERQRVLSGTRANPDGTHPEVTEILPEPDKCGEAREKAAKATGANPRYVSDVLKLQREAPDLFEAVASGAMGIPKALRELEKQRDERTDEETSSTRAEFLVVVRDEADARPARAPEVLYGPKTYPNIALFRLHEAGDTKVDLGAKRGFAHVALFAVPVEPSRMIKDMDGRPFCKASCRFLALSVRGTVPEPATVPTQIIDNDYPGVFKMVEAMFPKDLKVLVSTEQHDAPQNWRYLLIDSKNCDDPAQPAETSMAISSGVTAPAEHDPVDKPKKTKAQSSKTVAIQNPHATADRANDHPHADGTEAPSTTASSSPLGAERPRDADHTQGCKANPVAPNLAAPEKSTRSLLRASVLCNCLARIRSCDYSLHAHLARPKLIIRATYADFEEIREVLRQCGIWKADRRRPPGWGRKAGNCPLNYVLRLSEDWRVLDKEWPTIQRRHSTATQRSTTDEPHEIPKTK
jgi:hypothetical protein